MGKFAKDVKKFELKVGRLTPMVIKKIVFEMYIRIVTRTRYKTGRARGNWQISVGSPTSAEIDRTSSGPSGAELGSLGGYKGTLDVYILNNLNYITFLEYGTQHFAGDHMVATTVTEFQGIASRAAKASQGP